MCFYYRGNNVKPILRSTTVFGLLFLASSVAVDAQTPGSGGQRYKRPAISPYLDLLDRTGDDLTFQYFRRVRPSFEIRQQQLQTNRALTSLRSQVGELQQQEQQSRNSLLRPTGHATSFLNHQQYFGVGGKR